MVFRFMHSWKRTLAHAFAVEPEGPSEPTKAQRHIVDKVCREIVRRQLSTPTLTLLELTRPVNYLCAQAIHYFSPFLSAVMDARGHRHFAEFLESRGAIDYLCRRIEELEYDRSRHGTT